MRKNSFSLVGPIAEETLRRLNADILFLGVDGFDVHYGLSTPNLLEAKVNRAMMDVARSCSRRVRLQQVRTTQLVFDCAAVGVHHLITDQGIPKPDLAALKKTGMQVTLV